MLTWSKITTTILRLKSIYLLIGLIAIIAIMLFLIVTNDESMKHLGVIIYIFAAIGAVLGAVQSWKDEFKNKNLKDQISTLREESKAKSDSIAQLSLKSLSFLNSERGHVLEASKMSFFRAVIWIEHIISYYKNYDGPNSRNPIKIQKDLTLSMFLINGLGDNRFVLERQPLSQYLNTLFFDLNQIYTTLEVYKDDQEYLDRSYKTLQELAEKHQKYVLSLESEYDYRR